MNEGNGVLYCIKCRSVIKMVPLGVTLHHPDKLPCIKKQLAMMEAKAAALKVNQKLAVELIHRQNMKIKALEERLDAQDAYSRHHGG